LDGVELLNFSGWIARRERVIESILLNFFEQRGDGICAMRDALGIDQIMSGGGNVGMIDDERHV